MILTIVPCSQRKIWKANSNVDKQLPAKIAYTGPMFKKGRAIAEFLQDKFDVPWKILSAKYGLIEPDTLISDYNVSFNKKKTNPISVIEIKASLSNNYKPDKIIVLGGKNYCYIIKNVFESSEIYAPVLGYPIGIALHKLGEIYEELQNSETFDVIFRKDYLI